MQRDTNGFKQVVCACVTLAGRPFDASDRHLYPNPKPGTILSIDAQVCQMFLNIEGLGSTLKVWIEAPSACLKLDKLRLVTECQDATHCLEENVMIIYLVATGFPLDCVALCYR